MKELMRTTDMVLINAVTTLLEASGIGVVEFDSHMSVLEGSIAVLVPRRLMVGDEDLKAARTVLVDAGLSEHLPKSAR